MNKASQAPQPAVDWAMAATAPTAEAVEAVLRSALEPTELDVIDDSHLHAGHAGAREGGHYTVRILSERFEGMGRVARHRLVYDALQGLIRSGIHALAIQARSPHD